MKPEDITARLLAIHQDLPDEIRSLQRAVRDLLDSFQTGERDVGLVIEDVIFAVAEGAWLIERERCAPTALEMTALKERIRELESEVLSRGLSLSDADDDIKAWNKAANDWKHSLSMEKSEHNVTKATLAVVESQLRFAKELDRTAEEELAKKHARIRDLESREAEPEPVAWLFVGPDGFVISCFDTESRAEFAAQQSGDVPVPVYRLLRPHSPAPAPTPPVPSPPAVAGTSPVEGGGGGASVSEEPSTP